LRVVFFATADAGAFRAAGVTGTAGVEGFGAARGFRAGAFFAGEIFFSGSGLSTGVFGFGAGRFFSGIHVMVTAQMPAFNNRMQVYAVDDRRSLVRQFWHTPGNGSDRLIRKSLLVLITVSVSFPAALLSAQTSQSGVLSGTVRTASGAPLAGVTVTAESDSVIGGSRTAATDSAGRFRFPALPPGAYRVTTSLAGFRRSEGHAQLQPGDTIRFDVVLDPGNPAEATTPSPLIAAPAVMVSEHLTSAFLASMPIAARFGPGAMLLAPGINPDNYSAFGSVGASSNAYHLDDLDSSDPESGRSWVFPAHHWLEDVQVIGSGAGAEYGGYTGASSGSLLRSGGSTFHGLAEILYRNSALTNANASDDVVALNPDLAPGHTDLVTDNSFQIGGPLKRDAVWFFAGAHFYYSRQTPGGYPPASPSRIPTVSAGTSSPTESSPRVLFKPTWKLSRHDTSVGVPAR
jgi:hypothetical protein